MMKEVHCETQDPKKIMDMLILIKEGIVKEYEKYSKADKNPLFKPQLLAEVCKLSEKER